MNPRIIKKEEIKSFYESSFKKKKSNKERLLQTIDSEFKQFLKKINCKKNCTTLDLAYGYGNYTIELARRGFNVVAVDFVSKEYLKRRAERKGFNNRIMVIQKDLDKFFPSGKYNVIVALAILHLFSKNRFVKILKEIIKSTKKGGGNYLSIFVDIKREFRNGTKIIIEGEANFSKNECLKILDKLYEGWKVETKFRKRKELNHPGLEKPYNLRAEEILWKAYR